MPRIALVTQSATYQGDLDLTSPSGEVRLLDALNAPHRLTSGGTAVAPSLLLRNALRRDDVSGAVHPCGGSVALRPGSILAAYEVVAGDAPPAGRERAERKGAVYEQRRHTTESQRVVIYLENGLRLEGSVGGGLMTLDSARPGKSDFVACLDVQVFDPRREGVRALPFVAINVRRIEGGGLLQPS
jgi:hypothetical protein